ncbi:putative tropomyosin isoform 1/2 [Histomonas meleagridis]|uniref:putative tropomyosin isoform 1/2 n=1 Tax=Histomonas meleagridis TaxID=135588 RepID=UPI00355A2277|nr:putative tropomyosin isoform 1/2 [Histomonas meleagridis]KAH0798611.1 putative tropomyosin isoform 1/2 [Histomonas meleagridis]
MQSELLHSAISNNLSISRMQSQIASSDKLRELISKLNQAEKQNSKLEITIKSKETELNELQSRIQMTTNENYETQKRLKSLKKSTYQLQQQLIESEQRYQDEIAQLRAQSNLQSRDSKDELESIDKELKERKEEQQLIDDFENVAQKYADLELQKQQEKLNSAQNIIQHLNELLQKSEKKTLKLNHIKDTMENELNNLKIKKQQNETSISTSKVIDNDKEIHLRNLIKETQEKLKLATLKIEVQSEQIKNKQKEINMLQDEIGIYKSRIIEIQNQFLRKNKP